jgi:uncharacterized membrane protein YphA (DoxX/SURF4 family)
MAKDRGVRPNPLSDVQAFLSVAAWTTVGFWLLLVGSVIAAALAWRANPAQRSMRHIGIWLLRLVLGAMWWEQSLWKVPPNYDGLIYWMKQMVDHAAVPLQSVLVRDVVLPNIAVFGPLVYAVEVTIGISLMLGVLSRLGAVLGALMAINLWLGLYSAPGEWPWTYGFLVILQLLFAIDPAGCSLGIDALERERRGALALLT